MGSPRHSITPADLFLQPGNNLTEIIRVDQRRIGNGTGQQLLRPAALRPPAKQHFRAALHDQAGLTHLLFCLPALADVRGKGATVFLAVQINLIAANFHRIDAPVLGLMKAFKTN